MSTMRVTSPADIPDVAVSIMGFHPVESLVVLSLDGGPAMRVDLPLADDYSEVMAAITPAAEHWSRIIVAVFSERDVLNVAVDTLVESFGWLKVEAAVRADGPNVWAQGWDEPFTRRTDAVDQCPDARPLNAVARSRQELEFAASQINDAAEALALAWHAYDSGDGAGAWSYVDRFAALATSDPENHDWSSGADLVYRLTHAVKPTEVTR